MKLSLKIPRPLDLHIFAAAPGLDMKLLSAISLRKQLWVLLSFLALTGILLGLIQWRLSASNDAVGKAFENKYVSTELANELRRSSDDLTRLARTYVVTGDPKWEQQYNEVLAIRSGTQARPLNYDHIYWDFRAADESVPSGVGETVSLTDLMKRSGFTDEEFSKLREAQQNSNDLVKTETIAMNMVKGLYQDDSGNFTKHAQPDLEKARTMMHDADYHRFKAKIMRPIDQFLSLLDARTSQSIEVAQAAARLWKITFVATALILFGTFALLLTLVFKRVLGAMESTVATAKLVAAGDLTSRFDTRGNDEIAQLATTMQLMNSGLSAIVAHVRRSSETIASGVEEIAAGNANLSQRTEEQAASLQQTAASMEEITAAVRNSADNARAASNRAAQASDVANKGGHLVQQVVSTMREITESSSKVAEIINVIEGIAFQTNILALNAAVEAARAGEQGRGFAVVAGEVRALAQRSASAAKEIKVLIGESSNRINVGSELVESTGQTIEQVVVVIKELTSMMSEVASTSEQQRQGVEEVNKAMVQMDEVTQQNAALVEQSATALHSVADQSRDLVGAVARFHLARVQ
jgi:methyl-accepting chemotaxis protein